jgi:hypothetical protein
MEENFAACIAYDSNGKGVVGQARQLMGKSGVWGKFFE